MECLEEWSTMLEEGSSVDVLYLDFRKAFDTIEHDELWAALIDQGVSRAYVNLLSSLYCDQAAHVKTDRMSRHFNIERRTK